MCAPAALFLGAHEGALSAERAEACAAHLAQHGLSFLLLVSVSPAAAGDASGTFARQLAIIEPPAAHAHAAAARAVLAKLHSSPLLRLCEIARAALGGGGAATLFEQGNRTVSRKGIVPLIQEWLASECAEK